MAIEHLIEGLDPTAVNPITPADLLQMVRASKPVATEGWIHWSDAAPDVVANPEMANFLWGRTVAGVKPNPLILYYWDGVAWTLLPLIDGSMLADGSVTLSKLSLTGALDYYIIQHHPVGVVSWVDIINAIQNGSVPPAKLQSPGAVSTYILTSIAGVRAFVEISTFFTNIANGTIPITKLVPGAANTFLRVNNLGNSIVFGTADVSDLLAAGALAGQVPVRNAGNTGWTWFTPNNLGSYERNNAGAYWTVPGSASSVAMAHGLGAIPKWVRPVLRCATNNNGYLAGEEMDLSAVTADIDGTNQMPAFSFVADSANVTVACVGYATGIYFVPKAGGAFVNFVAANWQLKLYLLN